MGGYKEHKVFDMLKRKSIIIKYSIFILFIFVAIILLLTNITRQNKTKDIVYTENSNVDYKVYLKENDFFETAYLEKDNQYIASIIDYIEADFSYNLEASEKDVDYAYTYKIVAEAKVEDKENHNTLYKFTEDLLEEQEKQANTNSKLRINEPIKVDYNKYNDIINRFVNIYDLEGSNSILTIKMYVDVKDDIEQDNAKYNTPAMSLTIPLTTKTIAIDIESNSVNENNISVCKTMNNGKYLFGVIILLVIDIILVAKLFIFIKDTKNEKAVYNMRLRKIMSNYGSYIQKLNNEFEFDGYQILEIKSFEDLLQIRETINKPILMTEKAIIMETYFFIPSEKDVYVYELKAGNLKKVRGRRYKEKHIEDIEEIEL